MNRQIALIVLCLIVLTGCHDPGDTPVAKNGVDAWWEEFSDAMAMQDESRVRRSCESAFWSAEDDSGQQLFEQAVRKSFQFRLQAKHQSGSRAVITADILRDDRIVDTIYLYLSKNEDWRLNRWDESQSNAQEYLARN